MINPKSIYINGTKVVGNSKGSSGPLLRRVEKRMPKVRVGEDQGVRSTPAPFILNVYVSVNWKLYTNTMKL